MTKKLDSEYVKSVENENIRLEDELFKRSVEIKKLNAELAQTRTVNETFSSCLTSLLERYGSDKTLAKMIMSTLNDSAKQLLKK